MLSIRSIPQTYGTHIRYGPPSSRLLPFELLIARVVPDSPAARFDAGYQGLKYDVLTLLNFL